MKLTLTALSPIAHGAFEDGIGKGNVVEFRKVKVVKDGKIYDVPSISGNAVRGIIRRNLAREFFEKNNLREILSTKENDLLYSMIGNGGALGKNLEVAVDCEYQRELRKQLPLLSLLGSACYTFMLNGICNIDFFKVKCSELGTGSQRIYDLLSDVSEARLPDKNIINTEELGIKPMPYSTETVIEGAEFEGNITLAPMATDIEKSCLTHGIKSINKVGGRIARGYGSVSVSCDEKLDDSLYIENITNIDIDFIKDFLKRISK